MEHGNFPFFQIELGFRSILHLRFNMVAVPEDMGIFCIIAVIPENSLLL